MDIIKAGGWLLYIATGTGFIVFTALDANPLWILPIALIALGYFFGLSRHVAECGEAVIMSKNGIFVTMAATIGAAAITWLINHELGYGALVASGLIGVIAGVTLPPALAGAAYVGSFVGMSAGTILPTIGMAVIGGALAGLITIATVPIFGGIGGKGGTTAAAAVLLTATLIFTVGM
ncbi:MAG: hypothetical protein R6U92_04350 [Bacillota bacterium]